MRTLAYQWLATHHIAGTDRATDFAPAYTVTSVTDTNGVRDVHGTFQVPLFLADTTPFSGLVTDAAGNPTINGAQDLDRELHLRAAVDGAERRDRRHRRSTATACSGARARSRAARSRPASPTTSWAARPTGSACRSNDIGERRAQPAGHVDVRHPGRPHAAGLRELPVPRAPDQLDVGLRHRSPRSSPAGSRCSRRTTATSWATARAASWAARCRRCRPSGRGRSSACPAWTTAGCC